jgi:hypothetical protein
MFRDRLFAGCLAILAWSSTASGQERARFTLDVIGCDWLRRDELERLLRLEMSAMASEGASEGELESGVAVQIECRPNDISVRITDSATGKFLERELVAPAHDHPSRERIVALGASQLLLASWLELLLPEPPKETRPAKKPPPNVTQARRAAKRAVVAETEKRRGGTGVAAGVAWRGSSDHVAMLGGGMYGNLALSSRFSLGLEARYERGEIERNAGTVVATLAKLGGSLGFRAWESRPLRVDTRLEVGGCFIRLDGRPTTASTLGSPSEGAGLDASLELAPGFVFGEVSIGPTLSTGFLANGPTGVVVGEESTTLNGVWFGAGLRAGLEL